MIFDDLFHLFIVSNSRHLTALARHFDTNVIETFWIQRFSSGSYGSGLLLIAKRIGRRKFMSLVKC
ncbi:MAG: hypothetical protein K2X47_02765, partial [Bdellovibrionales bacterium]|nr:hypothetical protein [Bdellovibrionales bacterium]